MPVSDKHNIQGYKELASLQLGGRVIILAEKPGADDPYMVVNCKWNNPLGANEYYDAIGTTDYFEAMREFIQREAAQLSHIETERSLSELPVHVMTAADCIPGSMEESIEGKLVLIKPEALSPEYRSAEQQIAYCTGGNGANPHASGRAVYCKMLYDGDQFRYNRHQIAGVVDPAKLPEWAQKKIAELDKPSTLAGQLAAGKEEAARHNAEKSGGNREKGHGPEER
jgi:hypothetical protein